MATADQPNASPSLRNLQILEVLALEARPMTATEINAVLQLPKPTIHRLVNNLEAEGFLSRHLDGFSLLPGTRMRQMMWGVLRTSQYQQEQRLILQKLHDQIGETCNVSVRDGDAMVYADRIETQWPLRIALHVGSRVPLYATAAGKMALSQFDDDDLQRFLRTLPLKPFTARTLTDRGALMQELQRIRARGYSTDSQEFIDGMIAVAVPILGPDQILRATLSFHGPLQRISLEEGLKHLPALQKAAAEIGVLLS